MCFFVCVQVLDGRIYEQVKDYLVSLCQTELEGYQTVYNTFSHLLNRSNGVSGFCHQSPVLKTSFRISFKLKCN